MTILILFLIRRLADWSKIIDKIEKGEKKIHRLSDIRRMIQEKVELHLEYIYGLMTQVLKMER